MAENTGRMLQSLIIAPACGETMAALCSWYCTVFGALVIATVQEYATF